MTRRLVERWASSRDAKMISWQRDMSTRVLEARVVPTSRAPEGAVCALLSRPFGLGEGRFCGVFGWDHHFDKSGVDVVQQAGDREVFWQEGVGL